jgi:hypothetical protein
MAYNMSKTRFLAFCTDKYFNETNILKYVDLSDTVFNIESSRFISKADGEGTGVYSDGDLVISWMEFWDDGKAVSLIYQNNFRDACFNAAVLHLATKVTATIKEGLPYGQVTREMDAVRDNWEDISKDLAVVEPDVTQLDFSKDEDVDLITVYLQSFARRVEIFMRDLIGNKFNSMVSENNDPDAEVKIAAKELKSISETYEKALQRDNTLFIEDSNDMFRTFKNMNDEVPLNDERISYEYIEIDENDFDDWQDWEETCPKCGCSDIVYTGMSDCYCNSCDHQWKVEIDQDLTNEYFDEVKAKKAEEASPIVRVSRGDVRGNTMKRK